MLREEEKKLLLSYYVEKIITILYMKIISRDDSSIVIDVPAKLNLFLDVLNRRPDGFHNIYSLFQAVSLYDRLEFQISPTPEVQISLTASVPLSVGEDNLISQAYRLMQERFGLTSGLDVRLTKKIPLTAGLAGGSADAAATIEAVNVLFNLSLSKQEKAELGLELGSDIPFFFSSGQVLVSGRGEIFEPVDLPLNYYTMLVTPPVFSSTKEAYSLLGRGLTDCEKRSYMTSCRKVEPFFQSLLERTNHFEAPLTRKFPVLEEIRAALNNVGARLARMSGSGPTMFGLFIDDPSEGLMQSLNPGQGWRVFIVRPVLLIEK